MESIDNNQFEIKPTAKTKRKVAAPCPNVYLNPALDLLANEDPMCNNTMEIVPKKRKRTRSCEIAAFENSALDIGISKAAVNEFLARELENVKRNVRPFTSDRCVSGDLTRKSDFMRQMGDLMPKACVVGVYEPKNVNGAISVDNIENLDPEKCHTDVAMAQIKKDIELESCLTKNIGLAVELPLPLPPRTNFLERNPINDINTTENEPTEAIYANLTEIAQTQIPTQLSVNFSMTNINIPGLPEPDVINTTTENGMDVSSVEETAESDSGILILDQPPLNAVANAFGNSLDLSAINNITNVHANMTNQIFINNKLNNPSNMSLSFIDRLALDSPNITNQSLCFDDDLNESNIMEIKTITIITKKKQIPIKRRNTNPFLDPNLAEEIDSTAENPFLTMEASEPEMEYIDEVTNRPIQETMSQGNNIQPRRLFPNDNSTVSTVNESIYQHDYENVDGYRSESPVYENIADLEVNFNKQSKILGHDVSHLTAVDILNLNKINQANNSNDSNDSKRDLKHQILKASKLSKKVLKKLKKTFKSEKSQNATLNPYEVPRKQPKVTTTTPKETGIENPGLDLDNSDDLEIEELDEEHQYEDIKTLRNTRLNMNVTPLKERAVDNADISHNRTSTPGKKVRFDSTLNQEKVITGNSFDYGVQSPGFDAKIDKFHDELENCINEKKFLQQNM